MIAASKNTARAFKVMMVAVPKVRPLARVLEKFRTPDASRLGAPWTGGWPSQDVTATTACGSARPPRRASRGERPNGASRRYGTGPTGSVWRDACRSSAVVVIGPKSKGERTAKDSHPVAVASVGRAGVCGFGRQPGARYGPKPLCGAAASRWQVRITAPGAVRYPPRGAARGLRSLNRCFAAAFLRARDEPDGLDRR